MVDLVGNEKRESDTSARIQRRRRNGRGLCCLLLVCVQYLGWGSQLVQHSTVSHVVDQRRSKRAPSRLQTTCAEPIETSPSACGAFSTANWSMQPRPGEMGDDWVGRGAGHRVIGEEGVVWRVRGGKKDMGGSTMMLLATSQPLCPFWGLFGPLLWCCTALCCT